MSDPMTCAVVVSLGRSAVRHAAAVVEGHLTPITACGTTIRADHYVHTGLPAVSCLRCQQALNKEA